MKEKKYVHSPSEIDGFRVVQDGEDIKKALLNDETLYHWESGDSLSPIINNMEYCRITPINREDVVVGDCVFCEIAYHFPDGRDINIPMVHRCTDIVERDGELWFRIDSTHGDHFGWTTNVYGRAIGTNIYQD
jgi:hypothetical protein